MSTPKLQHILARIGTKLSQADIPHALIGAMALALYGIPRYTADVDLLTDAFHQESLMSAMAEIDYQCYHRSDIFMQFDSLDGVSGEVDYLLVHTDEGRAIIDRSVRIRDELIGPVPVVLPTDYVVLKLMAIANNKERRIQDSADLSSLIKANAAGLINEVFPPLDFMHIKGFAKRFRLSDLIDSLKSRPGKQE